MPGVTDWIQAGSAVVQALGALGAIWFSVKIARDADARAREAERKAELRAVADEKASIERAEKAERIAEEREKIAAKDQQKALVAPLAMALLHLKARILREALSYEADYTQVPPKKNQRIMRAVKGPDTQDTINLALGIASKAQTPQLAELALRIKKFVLDMQDVGGDGPLATEWVSERKQIAATIDILLGQLEKIGA